jgi:hypothetical protein
LLNAHQPSATTPAAAGANQSAGSFLPLKKPAAVPAVLAANGNAIRSQLGRGSISKKPIKRRKTAADIPPARNTQGKGARLPPN